MCVVGLCSLPGQDVLFPHVFCYLDPEDWFSLRSVSHTFHNIVSQFLQENRILNLAYNKKLTEEAFKILTTDSHCLRILNVSGLKFLTDDLLRVVIINNPHLVSLELSDCHHLTSGILQTLSVRCNQLERLILRDCHWVSKESLEYHAHHQGEGRNDHLPGTALYRVQSPNDHHLLGTAPYRVQTPVSDHQVPALSKPRCCLHEVDLTGCWELDDKVIIIFLSKFPHLSTVKLGNIYSLTDLTMRALATYTTNLRVLDITGCWRVTDQGVRQVGEYNRSLSMLSVNDCRDVTEQSLSRLRQSGVVIDRKLDPVMLRLQRIRNEQRQARLQI